jgi:fibronectin-binding autotransporter adhesin
MKKRSFLYRLSGAAIGVATVLGVSVGHVAAAGQNCTWTGGGGNANFSTSGNWSNCGGSAPGTGDNLIFDATATSLTPNNDMTGASFANVSFTGSFSSAGFTVSGNAFTITGGVTDNSTGTWTHTFSAPVTFSGSQSISGTHATGGGPSLAFSGVVTITGGTLTINTIPVTFSGALSGSGGLTLSGSGSTSLTTAASGYSGAISIGSGSTLTSGVDGALGTGSITIASGGSLYINSTNTNVTMANAFTLAGTGVSNQGALNITLGTGVGTLTLSGAVTLTADTTIQPNGSTVNVTGTYTSNGHLLSASTGTLNLPSSGTTTATSPKTGLAGVRSNPLLIFAVTAVAALTLGGFAVTTRRKAVR